MLSSTVIEVSHYLMTRMPKPHLVPHRSWGDTRDFTKVWPFISREVPGLLRGLGASGYMDQSGPDWDSGRL